MGVPVVIGGDNLPSPVGIGLTDMPNIGGPVAPLALAPPVPASLVHDRKFLKNDFLLLMRYVTSDSKNPGQH